MRNKTNALALVGPRPPCRPAAVPARRAAASGGRCGNILTEQDFVEVEAAILQVSPGNEAHLHAFATEIAAPSGARAPLYLHTSPEFACKKLLAAGERRIFEFARVFRNRERGALHHPEFTLLEWYRAHEPYEALMARLRWRSRAGGARPRAQSNSPSATAPPIPLPSPSGSPSPKPSTASPASTCSPPSRRGMPIAMRWRQQARKAGVRIADDDGWSDIFSRVLVERVEPQARHRPADDP